MSTITLFDRDVNPRFQGALILKPEKTESKLSQILKQLRARMEADVHSTLGPATPSLPKLVTAYTFLFLSVFFFTLYLLPIIVYNLPSSPAPRPATSLPITIPAPVLVASAGAELVEDKSFKLFIPKIGLEENIIPNVDINNEEEYKLKLTEGIAHAKGSYLPGEPGMVYLFSHSTNSIFNILRYDAHFFGLKDVEKGDKIEVLYKGKKYTYTVSQISILDPDQIDKIRESTADLVLQTCWPLGTDWQRLVVFADETTKL